MIVVLASRHDEVALELVARWPDAALCSAEDLTRPGWVWPVAPGPHRASWVVDDRVVPDEQVSGVFVRRSMVHAAELVGTHPADRAYLAMEMHAFLVHVLARTAALVVNPVDEGGAYGEAALRPERWLQAASELGVAAAPLRIRSSSTAHAPIGTTQLEVVGERVVGSAPAPLAAAALQLCRQLALRWAVTSFDEQGRLSAITTAPAPSKPAAAALARLLAARSAA